MDRGEQYVRVATLGQGAFGVAVLYRRLAVRSR